MRKGGFPLKGLLSFLCVILISAQSFGQKFFMPEGIIHKTLDNGFSYYIIPNGEPGKIGVYLFSNTGSYVEKKEERGVAHFLEHMVFKGSKNFPGNKTTEALESMGLRIGRDYNGSVNPAITEYQVSIPENNKATLEKTLFLMSDWAQNLQMDANDLEVEKKVVIEEIKLRGEGGTPFLIGTYLEGHNGLGTAEQINSVTTNDVKDFYKKYYTPNQLALVVNGKVDVKQVEKLIKNRFGKMPAVTSTIEDKYLDLSKETIVDSGYATRKSDMLVLGFKTRDFSVNSFESYKKDLIYRLFCEMLENRLDAWPNSDIEKTSANMAVPFTGNLWFNFRLEAKQGASYKTMLQNFTDVIAQARRFGFLQEEIDFFINTSLKRYKSAEASGNSVNDAKAHFLKGDVPLSVKDKLKFTQQIANTISPDDFTALLNSFTGLHKTILYNSKASAFQEGFNQAYILGAIKHINKNTKVAPYQFTEPRDRFPVKDYSDLPTVSIENKSPKPIKSKEKLGDYLYLLNYENGIKVLVNTAPKAETQIKIVGNHGLNAIPEQDRGLFGLVMDGFDKSYGTYSEKEARDLKRKLGFYTNIELSNDAYEFGLKGSKHNVVQLIKIFNLMVNNQTAPNMEEVNKSLQRHFSRDRNHNNGYSDFLDNVNGLGLPVPTGTDTTVTQTMLERFLGYNTSFKRALSQSYVYVGGALPENVDELISTYVATIEPFGKLEYHNQPLVLANDTVVKTFPWKKSSTKDNFMFSHKSNKKLSFKDKLIIEGIAEFGYKNIYQVLRKKYGYIYALGATGFTNKAQNLSTVSLRYMVEEATNVPAARKAMKQEVLPVLAKAELSNTDIAAIKALLEKDYVTSFYENDRISADYLKWGLDYGKLYTMEAIQKEIQNISKEDIEKHMKRMFTLDSFFLLIESAED